MSVASRADAIAICGPTSSGKSEIAVLVAEAVGGEIVNADSRQVYRDIPVGTGAPPGALLRRVSHHLFGFVDPCTRYSAGAYVEDAHRVIDAIVERGHRPIIVGGTGLYVEALAGTMPMDRAVADDDVRARVKRESSLHRPEFLRAWLEIVAPDAARRVPWNDRYRTLRAIEAALVERATAARGSGARGRHAANVPMRFAVLVLDDAVIEQRISARVRAMFDGGLVDEANDISRRCAEAPALTGLGYAEALAWLRGEATREEAIEATIVRTRRYAKRQRTWFRRLRGAALVDARDASAAAAAIVRLARETARPA